MSLNVQQIYKDKASRVNANEASTAFNRSFLNALTETLASIQNFGLVSITIPSSTDAVITELDEGYYPAVSAGLDWFLHLRSEWSIDDPRQLQRSWELERSRLPFLYFKDNAPQGRSGDLT